MSKLRPLISLSLLLGSTSFHVPLDLAADSGVSNPPPIECIGSDHDLLLENRIVLTNVRWRTRSGNYGCGHAISHRGSTGHFWFFDPDNLELTCKALNGGPVNGKYWVFCGALTDVEWWMNAIDNSNPSNQKEYYNPGGNMASFGDTEAITLGLNQAPSVVLCPEDQVNRVPRGSTGAIVLTVNNPDLDSLSADIAVVQGEGMTVAPRWSNPVPEGHEHYEFSASFSAPFRSELVKVRFEVRDPKLLLPIPCELNIVVE